MAGKMSRRFVLQASAGIIGAPLVARYAHAAEYSLKIGSDTPPTYPLNVRVSEAITRIKDRTSGNVELALFPNSQLGGDMLNQVRSGSLEFFLASSLLVVPIVPICGLTGVGFAFKDVETAYKAMDGDVGAYLRKQMDKAGLFALETIYQGGFRQIISGAKPISTPSDLAGFKIRVPISPTWVSLFTALRASPTPINIAEVYTALQTRIVDGAENYLSLLNAMRLYEVQKYISMTNHIWDGYWMLGSARMWKTIPKAFQEVIREEFNKSALDQRRDMADIEAHVRGDMTAAGLSFNDPDTGAFRDMLRKSGYYADWKGKFGGEAWELLEKYTGAVG
jgi:tripartite ATP-independent transporter DctP family solute receptor